MLKTTLILPSLFTAFVLVNCSHHGNHMPPAQLPSVEELTERLPHPYVLRPAVYEVDPPKMVYHLELTLEANVLNQNCWDMDESYLKLLNQMNPKVHLRFTKKVILKTNDDVEPSEYLIKFKEAAIDLITRDEDINELLEDVPLSVDVKKRLLDKLSNKGRLIRASRDGDVGFLSKRTEAARQGDIDGAFIDSVERYQAAVNAELRDAEDKLPVLEFLSLHASEKAIEDAQPKITEKTLIKIKRGRKAYNSLESPKIIKPSTS